LIGIFEMDTNFENLIVSLQEGMLKEEEELDSDFAIPNMATHIYWRIHDLVKRVRRSFINRGAKPEDVNEALEEAFHDLHGDFVAGIEECLKKNNQ